MAMFMKAAEHVANISGEKTLHAVTDLNTAERFKPLCIVERKKSFWFWKKPTMNPTFVKMNDLVQKDLNLSASKNNFILLKDFEELPTLQVSGSVSAKILSEANVQLKAEEKLNVVLKLGDIEKNEVFWKQLSDALVNNPVTRNHPLYLRVKQHPSTSLCVVIGSISTKDDGALEEDKSTSISTDDTLKVNNLSVISAEVHVKASVEKKSVYSFTIPPGTVLAYSCVEFSISQCGNLITLHSMFDTFDDKETRIILAPANTDSEDGGSNADEKEDLIVIIKNEFASLIHCEKFEEIKHEIKVLIFSASDNNNMFQSMHSLLHRADQYLVSKDADNFILMAPFNRLLEDDKELPWKQIMTLLGFSVPKDGGNDDAFVVLPGNYDNANLIKSCMGLVDAILDFNQDARKVLPDISFEDINLIMNIIEMQLQNKVIYLKDISDQLTKDSSALKFLKECGFLLSGEDQAINFADRDKSSLLDVYIVLYVLFAEHK